MQLTDIFARSRFVFLDGGMGTQLTARGLQPGQKPELAALTMPETLTAIHRDYARAGAEILCANTFGANPRKLAGAGCTVDRVVAASIALRPRRRRRDRRAGGLGMSARWGSCWPRPAPWRFEDAVDQFAQVVEAGVKAGADLVFLETMTDLYELKAALLAVREHSRLPVFASMSL